MTFTAGEARAKAGAKRVCSRFQDKLQPIYNTETMEEGRAWVISDLTWRAPNSWHFERQADFSYSLNPTDAEDEKRLDEHEHYG